MKIIGYFLICAMLVVSLGCAGMTATEQRTLSGGAAGAGAGALIGGPVGAGVGGVAGAAAGHQRPEIEQKVEETREAVQ
jgi:osmotically inducible lipoprotein OsmB